LPAFHEAGESRQSVKKKPDYIKTSPTTTN